MAMTKADVAPLIVAGIYEGYEFFDVFFDEDRPEREQGEPIDRYRRRVTVDVIRAACQYMSEQFRVTERMGAIIRMRKDRPS